MNTTSRIRQIIALLLCLAAVMGCSTLKNLYLSIADSSQIDQPNAKKRATISTLKRLHRRGYVYLDYRPVLIIDAIHQNAEYQERYARVLAQSSLSTEQARTAELANRTKQIAEFENFIVFVYGGSNESLELQSKNAQWKLFLKNGSESPLGPSSLEKVKKKDLELLFLQNNVPFIDRWSEAYRVRFPKSAPLAEDSQDDLPGTPALLELIASGVLGKTSLSWNQ